MANLRPARVVYQVYTRRLSQLKRKEVEGALGRHSVPAGSIEVKSIDCAHQPELVYAHEIDSKDFIPPLDFEEFVDIHRARWIHLVEVTDREPEDLGYLRSGLLVAGELAALTKGRIVDALALKCMTPADVVHQIDRAFDPLDHVSVHVEAGTEPFWVHTHGLEKFAHADFQLHAVPRPSVQIAVDLLKHLVAAVVAGGSFLPAETNKLCGFQFEFQEPSNRTQHHFSDQSLTMTGFHLLHDVARTPATEGMLGLTPA